MKMKSLPCICLSVILFFIFTVVTQGPASAQKATEWKMLCGWTPDILYTKKMFLPFVEKVNQRATGKLKISWFGPEAVPPFEQLKPVREGLFDGVFTVAAYHPGEVPAALGMSFYSATGKERRAAGLYKLADELYRKKANVLFLGAVPDGTGYQFILRKKIDKADLTGLKIRSTPYYDPLIRALNGIPVTIPQADAYSALEKGVVDGAGTTTVAVLDYHFEEVTKYMVRPAYGEGVFQININLSSWNRLSPELQEILNRAMIETEEEGRAAMVAALKIEEAELIKRGMERVILPTKEAEKYLKLFYDRSWEELVLKRDAEFGPRIKKIADEMIHNK